MSCSLQPGVLQHLTIVKVRQRYRWEFYAFPTTVLMKLELSLLFISLSWRPSYIRKLPKSEYNHRLSESFSSTRPFFSTGQFRLPQSLLLFTSIRINSNVCRYGPNITYKLRLG